MIGLPFACHTNCLVFKCSLNCGPFCDRVHVHDLNTGLVNNYDPPCSEFSLCKLRLLHTLLNLHDNQQSRTNQPGVSQKIGPVAGAVKPSKAFQNLWLIWTVFTLTTAASFVQNVIKSFRQKRDWKCTWFYIQIESSPVR